MAAQPLAVQVGVAPACQALGVSRATFYRRQRPTPGHQQPRPTPARALCDSEREQCSTCSPPLASSIARPPRSPPRCSMKANTCARSARCIGSWPRISRSESGAINVTIPSTPSPSWWPRGRTKPGPGTSPSCWGRRSGRTSTSTSYSTSSAATRRLDGRRPGELSAGRSSHRADLPQTGRPAPGPHPALRPRGAHDQQMHRATARRPRDHSLAEPPPRQR